MVVPLIVFLGLQRYFRSRDPHRIRQGDRPPGRARSDDAVLGRLMLAFEGTDLPAWTADRLA